MYGSWDFYDVLDVVIENFCVFGFGIVCFG